jgi:hypothetical protein
VIKRCSFLFLLVFAVFSLYAQEIVTAEKYLETVSVRYGGVKDYEAHVVIRSGSADMTGQLSYLSPNFLRIDFSKPNGQVIAFNGEQLTVYLPEYRAVLNQEITSSSRSSAAGGGFPGIGAGSFPAQAELCIRLCDRPRTGAPRRGLPGKCGKAETDPAERCRGL